MSVTWHGDAVAAKILAAAKTAVDETTLAIAENANGRRLDLEFHKAGGYRWFGVSPRVVRTVRNESARVQGTRVRGRVGDTAGQGDYGLLLERMQPYMRPALDEEAPQLADRIKRRVG